MEELYKTPESNLLDSDSNSIINHKLYKVSGIGLATFVGTVFAGGLLLSKNFKHLGKEAEAKRTLLYSILATLVIFIIIFLIPEDWNIPGMAISLPQVIFMAQYAKQTQEADILNHVDNGGQLASNWKAFGISLLVCLLILAVLLVISFASI